MVGPTAKKLKAYRQVNHSTSRGMIWIVKHVNKKPSEVCIVSIVPTSLISDSSAIAAENWPESAMTEMPQTIATSNTRKGETCEVSPIRMAQEPLIAIAKIVTAVLPIRSASTPATMQPKAPLATTKNVAKLTGKYV